jgi:hypothetical protein
VKASRRYLSLIETPADARYEEPDKEPANPEPQVSVA